MMNNPNIISFIWIETPPEHKGLTVWLNITHWVHFCSFLTKCSECLQGTILWNLINIHSKRFSGIQRFEFNPGFTIRYSSIGNCEIKVLRTYLEGQSYSKTCLKRPLKKDQKIDFQDRLLLNAGQKYCRMLQREHSAILSTFIKIALIIKILVLSICEWPLKTGFTVDKFIFSN